MGVTVVANALDTPEGTVVPESRSLWQLRWNRFKKHRLALAALIVLVVSHLAIVFGVWFYPVSPETVNPLNALQPPSVKHPLGTDESGRDTLARLLQGGSVSLRVGVFSMAVSITVGTLVGGLAGYFGGWVDLVLMRLTDALMSLPTIFLLLVILTLFPGGLATVTVVIGLTSWMGTARLVRGEVLQWKPQEFVQASLAVGAPDWFVLFRHVLPNAYSSLIVAATLGVARAMLLESALSYLGLGIQPPMASLGNMLTNAQSYVWNAPLQALWPGLLILILVLTYNLLGDGLRDALDPRMNR